MLRLRPCLALLVALPLHATPVPHPDAAFLAQLSGAGFCPAQLTAGLTPVPQVIPPPQPRVIWMRCGTCGDPACFNHQVLEECPISGGGWGLCQAQNNTGCFGTQTQNCTCG